MTPLRVLYLMCLVCFQLAEFSGNSECLIELECEECLPEHMPTVTSHAARHGVVRVAHGEEVTLACGGPFVEVARATLVARCDDGRYVVDGRRRHLLDLGCQRDVAEDVLHPVEWCAPPLQGRVYQTGAGTRTVHLAAVCYDADRALPVHVRTCSARELPLAAHSDVRAPLSILGSFNQMFEESSRLAAERLFSDEARLDRRVRELFKYDRYTFADQRVAAGRLLAPEYLDARDVRVASFVTNNVVSWRSVVGGNLRHLHEDVAELMSTRAVEVWAGTHGVGALRVGDARRDLYLRGGRRFPVPRYIWTVVVGGGAGVALVVLNDPFVTVSEIREAVFCESLCARIPWLARLTRHRNYERPALGLAFCCELSQFAATVHEMPRLFNSTVPLLT